MWNPARIRTWRPCCAHPGSAPSARLCSTEYGPGDRSLLRETMTVRAQDRFRELMRDHLGPALRAMGFKGGRQDFVLPDDRHWILLGVQRSRWSDSTDVEFTIQLTVADRQEWDRLRAEHGYGDRPYSTRFYGPTIWQTRLGNLMGKSDDGWWHVRPDSDLAALGAELASAVRRSGLPAIRAEMASTMREGTDLQ